MKPIILALFLLFSSQILFASSKQSAYKQTVDDKFNLSIGGINVEAIRSSDWIKTKNILPESKAEFQVEYHFDGGQLFYIRLVKPDSNIDKKYGVKRVMKDGYGYISVQTDYKIDFSFPREKQENDNEKIKLFAYHPDFTNNEQIIGYFEELYRNIQNHIAQEVGTVAFFGDAILKNKIVFLYYKFDNENFSATKKINIQNSNFDNQAKKYLNGYRIIFDRKQLKNRKTIFFSAALNDLQNAGLIKQNCINLVELRKQITPSENEKIINNDIFLDQEFELLISTKNQISEAEKQYPGTYTTKSSDKITFELGAANIYHKQVGDLEYIGLWKLGESAGKKAINVYSIYTVNRKIGNKTRPADFGSSFNILINSERLLYPIDLPAYAELEKISKP